MTIRRDCLHRDTRGAVYVEFLFAFMPVFLMFLAVCQLSLIGTARMVVQHAALVGARSAIVILEEDPNDFDGAPRGDLSQGSADDLGLEAFLRAMNQGNVTPAASSNDGSVKQRGARMVPIRTAAYAPLLTLAPSASAIGSDEGGAVSHGIRTGLTQSRSFAVQLTRAASVVSVHSGEGAEALATEPIAPNATVTVRVTYFYHCAIPIVRTLICRTLSSLIGPKSPSGVIGYLFESAPPYEARMQLSESPGALERLASGSAAFIPITSEVTLPNQGAAYYRGENEAKKSDE